MRPTFSSLPKVVAALVCGAVLATAPRARAQDPEALAKVKDLNKKAIDAYEGLEMDDARKFLMQALELCAAEGLNKHPLKATTHVNLGVVLIGGFKQRDGGIKQFRRALEIESSVRIAKRLNNPEIQSAFDAAKEALANEPASAEPAPTEPAKPPACPPAEPGTPAATEPAPPKPPSDGPPADVKGIYHEPIIEAQPGATISVKAAVESGLAFEHLVLAYRPEGATDFLQRDMAKQDSGWYVARIPEPATTRASVSYYIEARAKGGQPVASNGSSSEPHQIALGGPNHRPEVGVMGSGHGSEGGAGNFWMSFGVGSGYGYAKGSPEVTPRWTHVNRPTEDIVFSGRAPTTLLHFVPEIGYFLSATTIISLQARLQLVTGATDVYDKSCQDGVCKPATGAVAVLGKMTWLFGESGGLRPYLSLAAGGGLIRHLVTVPTHDCGPDHLQECVDTVAGGPLLLGPAAGVVYPFTPSMFFTGSVNTLLAVPNTAFNVDLNVGLGMKL